MIGCFILVLFAFIIQACQLLAKAYESDDFSTDETKPESTGHQVLTWTLMFMLLLCHFLIGESTFQQMKRHGDDRKGEWGVVFLLVATITFMYAYIIGRPSGRNVWSINNAQV